MVNEDRHTYPSAGATQREDGHDDADMTTGHDRDKAAIDPRSSTTSAPGGPAAGVGGACP